MNVAPEPYDESEHIKETFAHFGLAAYMASVLETGLVHVLLQIDFLTSVKNDFIKAKGKGFDRAKYEAEFDAFMNEHFAQTMGNIIKRIEKQTELDQKLKERIVSAKARRDYLIHHYWREIAVPFSSKDGRDKMIVELQKDADTFEALDKDIRAAFKPAREKLGIKDEVLDAHVEKRMAELKGLQAE